MEDENISFRSGNRKKKSGGPKDSPLYNPEGWLHPTRQTRMRLKGLFKIKTTKDKSTDSKDTSPPFKKAKSTPIIGKRESSLYHSSSDGKTYVSIVSPQHTAFTFSHTNDTSLSIPFTIDQSYKSHLYNLQENPSLFFPTPPPRLTFDNRHTEIWQDLFHHAETCSSVYDTTRRATCSSLDLIDGGEKKGFKGLLGLKRIGMRSEIWSSVSSKPPFVIPSFRVDKVFEIFETRLDVLFRLTSPHFSSCIVPSFEGRSEVFAPTLPYAASLHNTLHRRILIIVIQHRNDIHNIRTKHPTAVPSPIPTFFTSNLPIDIPLTRGRTDPRITGTYTRAIRQWFFRPRFTTSFPDFALRRNCQSW